MTFTAVDTQKSSADIRIVAVDGTFTVRSKIALSGIGITARHSPGTYEVSKSAMKKLGKEFTIAADF